MSDRPVFHTLALDCPDPRTLAAFYVDLLGYAVSADSDDDWVTITGPGPQMSFQLAPDHVPPTWPKNDVPQQAHVDFFVTDIVAAHQRVLALGGRAIDPVEPRRHHEVSACTRTQPDTRSACADPSATPGDSLSPRLPSG